MSRPAIQEGRMRKVLVLGAGKIGGAIVDMLAATGDYLVTVADRDEAMLARMAPGNARRRRADVPAPPALAEAAEGKDVVVSALPFFLNPATAAAAAAAGAHYFDLTEDVATTKAVRALAAGAGTAFVPQCGVGAGLRLFVTPDPAPRVAPP